EVEALCKLLPKFKNNIESFKRRLDQDTQRDAERQFANSKKTNLGLKEAIAKISIHLPIKAAPLPEADHLKYPKYAFETNDTVNQTLVSLLDHASGLQTRS